MTLAPEAATAEAVRRRRRVPTAVLLIAPSIVFMTALFAWPLVAGVLEAVRGPDGFTTAHLQRMVNDVYFWRAARNTLLLIVILIPLQFALALTMALISRARPALMSLHFYIWAIPLAISDLAAGLVWLSIFTDRGYLNTVLHHLGLDTFSWLDYRNTATVFAAVLIAELWRATALVFVIVVAGLQAIPNDYDEAAQVFGATYWQRLRGITLPLLRPSLQVALILRTILALQTFAVAQALTGQNFPLLVGETYRWYVELQNPAVASAIAMVIMTISMVTSIVYLRTLKEQS